MAERAVLSIHTAPELSERLGRLAKSSGRSKSALANEALEAFVEQQEWMIAEIEAGFADVAAGRVIEHAEIRSFVASLGAGKADASGA